MSIGKTVAIVVIHRYRESDPRGRSDYLAEAEKLSAAGAAISDEWATHPG